MAKISQTVHTRICPGEDVCKSHGGETLRLRMRTFTAGGSEILLPTRAIRRIQTST
jgi:hypothetical protein